VAGRHDIFISALTYELGEMLHDLGDLPGVGDDIRQQLYDGGLRNYRVTGRSVVELAAGPMRRAVEVLPDAARAGLRRVIFASNSAWDQALHSPLELSRVLDGLGLPGLTPVGVSLSWCVNTHTALDLARMMIEADGDPAVLIVCADTWPETRPDRLVLPDVSVHSDAAACFVLTTEEGPFRLGATRMRLDPALGLLDREKRPEEFVQRASQGVIGTIEETLEASGLGVEDFSLVIPNNYSKFVCHWVADLMGFPSDQVYLKNLPRFAHGLCADNPINLRDFACESTLEQGQRMLLLGTGPYQWGAAVIDQVRSGVRTGSASDGDGEVSQPPLC